MFSDKKLLEEFDLRFTDSWKRNSKQPLKEEMRYMIVKTYVRGKTHARIEAILLICLFHFLSYISLLIKGAI